MKLRRSGNTFVVTIAKALVEALGWELGDRLKVELVSRNALRISREG